MRPVGIAVLIRPRGGRGIHVFRREGDRIQALYDIPDDRVILFDEDDRPAERFAYVCRRAGEIARSLPPGAEIRSLIRLMHGYPRGAQDGSWTHNVGEEFDAFEREDGTTALSEHLTVANFSCSNAATIGRAPDGDLSYADAQRDALCARGRVWCQTYGHLIAGHATYEIADRLGGTWRPLARWFTGGGQPEGGLGGVDVLPRGHKLLPVLYRAIRRSIDLDDDGPEPAMAFRFRLPWIDNRDELVGYLERFRDETDDAGRAEPTVLELQRALARGGYDPGPLDGVAGRRTTSAVRAFQRAAGLAVDGDPGPATWAALRAAGLLDGAA